MFGLIVFGRQRWTGLIFVLLLSCQWGKVPIQSVVLEETPVYPNREWGVITTPYTKVSRTLGDFSEANLKAVLQYGRIVQVLAVQTDNKNKVHWAMVRWREDTVSQEGWLVFNTLHVVPTEQLAELFSIRLITSPP